MSDKENRIYITYCSKDKNDCYKGTKEEVAPLELYTGRRIQAFMRKCQERTVKWAIFSDLYSAWGPYIKEHEKKKWYDKPPDEVGDKEFEHLLSDFDSRLREYDEIWFFHEESQKPHELYSRLISSSSLNEKIHLFDNLDDIV